MGFATASMDLATASSGVGERLQASLIKRLNKIY